MFTKEIMDTFTDLDLAVYDCIVKNRGRISRMPIKELAAMAHVSTATILRFCRKCGVDGYSEFKLKYKEHLEGKRDALKDEVRDIFPMWAGSACSSMIRGSRSCRIFLRIR